MNGKEQEAVLEEIKRYYEVWLRESDLTEEILLRFSETDFFEVHTRIVDGILEVGMYFGEDRELLGCPLMSPSAEDNKNFFLNASFLLLYISGKLDKARWELIGKREEMHFFQDRVIEIIKKKAIKNKE